MRRLTLVLVVLLGLVIAAPSAPASEGIQGPGAQAAKKCKKKGKKKKCKKRRGRAPVTNPPAPVVTPPPARPLALTEAEVTDRVVLQAYNYCLPDPFCYDYGIWVDDTFSILCDSKSTYQWACYGWNDEDYTEPPDGNFEETCTFREVVSRSGQSGITSFQDLSYGTDGWSCEPWPGTGP